MHDGHVHGPVAAVFLKLKLVPVSSYIKNMEIRITDDRKFIEVHVCQKLS